MKSALVLSGFGILIAAAAAQTNPSADQPAPATQAPASQSPDASSQPSTTPQPEPQPTHGKVLFSRSTDDPQTAAQSSTDLPVAEPHKPADPAAEKLADEERAAATFTAYDLDIRLFARQQSLAVRARFTLRNDADTPLKHLRLQLSSTLRWERILIASQPAVFKAETIPTDADHTGSATEAVIDLPTPLAPKASIFIDAMYSGQVPLTAARLEEIGTPTDIADRSDWDQLTDEAVALRGFGNVLWYPVSAPPVALGDGAKYFTEIGRQRLRQTGAAFQAQVTEEFIGDAPNVAILNGQVEPVTVTAPPSDTYPGVLTTSLLKITLNFQTPSLFLLRRTEVDGEDLQLYVTDAGRANAQNYLAAAVLVDPMIHQWLGGRPKTPLAIIDLPAAGDAPFESGPALFTGLGRYSDDADPASTLPNTSQAPTEDTRKIAQALSHALTHAYFQSPRPWLDEGVPTFLGSLWREQTKGREAALEAAEPLRQALAFAEPATPSESQGQSLIAASDPVYYRTKAAFVLGMLRDVAGDQALATALREYKASEDIRPQYFETLLEKAADKDLRWFFDCWVYRDMGLPDLSIANVFVTAASEPGQHLITIDVANEGYAEAEVPVIARSSETAITDRIRVPARGRVTHRIVLRGEPTQIQLNDGTVPEVQSTIHLKTIQPPSPH